MREETLGRKEMGEMSKEEGERGGETLLGGGREIGRTKQSLEERKLIDGGKCKELSGEGNEGKKEGKRARISKRRNERRG